MLLGAAQAAMADAADDLAAYRALFSVETLRRATERPGPSLAIGWSLQYRGAMPHAAFAFARDAAGRTSWVFAGGRASPDAARAEALGACRQAVVRAGFDASTPCRILAVDGAVEGQAGPGIIPRTASVGPFRAAPLLFHHGPQAAQGVVVWGHGFAGIERDLRGAPLPGFLAALNDAGWDVLRFDRDPAEDAVFQSQARLVGGLPALRAAGYRRVVLGGHSRGGWQALLAAAERPDQVEAVIAAAPGAHGSAGRANGHAAAIEDFRRVLAGLPDGQVRLGVVLFEGDNFDPDPEARARLVAELAERRSAPTLVLWPGGRAGAPADITGHGGVSDWRFTRLYAACLVTLVQAPAAAVARGLRRIACGGG